jgi:hypothetical protein
MAESRPARDDCLRYERTTSVVVGFVVGGRALLPPIISTIKDWSQRFLIFRVRHA